MDYQDYVLGDDAEIIREVQTYCAWLSENRHDWDERDGAHVATLLNRSKNPRSLFRFMDERTGSSYVGYKTKDGREWFHILRQMRNTRGSGLLENLH